MEKAVLPIHFTDRGGTEFERLVFAYVSRLKEWDTIEWLGQTGGDQGRDIWGVVNGESYCYQCANYRALTLKKVTEDIDKLQTNKRIPNNLIFVCGGTISNSLREKLKAYAHTKKIRKVAVWSSAELEEKLRKESPELIKRFVEGEAFPGSPNELTKYAKSISIQNDADIIDLIAECFDRPAFLTRFAGESSIPDFEKAIKDTIEVLNTGVHRLRDGTVIRTIPSRHHISDATLKKKLAEITKLVVQLRDSFIGLKRSGDIRPCGCNEVDCSSYMLSDKACQTMDKLREEVFVKLKEINPDSDLQYY